MRARFAILLAMVLVGTALAPVAARADGDPASDVLLGESVFYPYTPPVSASLTKQLNAATAAAAKAGFPLKIALIASPVDLGVIPDLFDKPQKYAEFLDLEISLQTKQPLLVVMPSGFGGAALGAATSALKTLPKPAGQQSNDLAKAAIPAVAKLAAAAGHAIKGGGAGGGTSHSTSSSTTILIALVIAALATAGTLIAVRRRRVRASA